MFGRAIGWTPLGSAPPVLSNAAPVAPTAAPAAPVPVAPAAPSAPGALSGIIPAATADGFAVEGETAPAPPPPTPAEILASARAAALEANKVWLKGWQEHNPWDASFPPPKPPKKASLALWAAPKPLSSRQRGTLKKLIGAGFPPAYARQLVERGDSNWIGIMMRNPVKRKRK